MFGEGQDMNALLQQAQQMQEQLMAAQEELGQTEVKGTAGGGLVTATVNGNSELQALEISPDAVDVDDIEGLSDLVVAAIRDATTNAQALASSKLGPMAGGMGL